MYLDVIERTEREGSRYKLVYFLNVIESPKYKWFTKYRGYCGRDNDFIISSNS